MFGLPNAEVGEGCGETPTEVGEGCGETPAEGAVGIGVAPPDKADVGLQLYGTRAARHVPSSQAIICLVPAEMFIHGR